MKIDLETPFEKEFIDLIKKNNNTNPNTIQTLLQSKKITYDIIIHYRDILYDPLVLYSNPNFDLEWIKDDLKLINKDYIRYNLIFHSNFKFEWILNYNLDWDYNLLIKRFDFDIDWVLKIKDIKNFTNFNIINISKHPNLKIEWFDKLDLYPEYIIKSNNFKIEWLKKFPNQEWNFNHLSSNPNFKIEWLELYPNQKWNFDYISRNDNFDIEWFEKYSKKSWNFEQISKNKNLKIEWVEKYPDKCWNYYDFNLSKHFKIDWIKNKLDENWNYIHIFKLNGKNYVKERHFDFSKINAQNINYASLASNIDINIVKKYYHLKWNLKLLFFNPDIDQDIILFIRRYDSNFFLFLYQLLLNQNFDINWITSNDLLCPRLQKLFLLHNNFSIEWFNKIKDPSIYKKNAYMYINKNYTLEWNKYLDNFKAYTHYLSKNKNFNIKWIKQYPHLNWNYDIIIHNMINKQ